MHDRLKIQSVLDRLKHFTQTKDLRFNKDKYKGLNLSFKKIQVPSKDMEGLAWHQFLWTRYGGGCCLQASCESLVQCGYEQKLV